MKTDKSLEQILEESRDQVVAVHKGRSYTQRELEAAFNVVANQENWKFAIDVTVTVDAAEIDAIEAAVPFFTGSFVTITRRGHKHQITADGYYRTVGA